MNAKLCATVTGTTTDALRQARDEATDADMVELRLDYAHECDIEGVLADRRVPVIVTCRPRWAGGRFAGSEEERGRLLSHALASGADFVDVEWGSACVALLDGQSRRLVLSDHDFDGVPEDLEPRYRSMRATGAQIVKIAAQVKSLSELIRLRALAGRSRPRNGDGHVVIGMGPAGVPSRLLPDHFGSAWTYASMGTSVAPGQLRLDQMVRQFQIRRAHLNTEIFGVLGSPLEHSLSPVMHNAGFAEVGRDAMYVPIEAADIADFEAFASAFRVQGVSVTAPFKEDVMTSCVRADELARQVGAVNTLRHTNQGWEGTNTDVPGFLAPLEGTLALKGCRATILGAGGAARGVAVALAREGAEVTVSARHRTRATAVASLVAGRTGEFPPARGSWDLLVNTTPVGTFPCVHRSPLAAEDLDGRVVYDLVYNPERTQLLSDAAAAGCRVVGGLGMLVAQAERQFTWWTGERPSSGLFRSTAERQLRDDATDPAVGGEVGSGDVG